MFLQKQDVRSDFGSGVGFESGVRQPYGANEDRTFRQILPNGRILFVHRVAARNESHHTARPRLVDRLGEKVIMNRPSNCWTAAISGIEHGIISERNITNDCVEE